jgi:glutathione S-transferase
LEQHAEQAEPLPPAGEKLMGIRISAFACVPSFAQALVRDLRVRWALEEAGLDYEERSLRPGDNTNAAYLRLQPFGQIPIYEEENLTLFESGAIVLHIAERCEKLLFLVDGPFP